MDHWRSVDGITNRWRYIFARKNISECDWRGSMSMTHKKSLLIHSTSIPIQFFVGKETVLSPSLTFHQQLLQGARVRKEIFAKISTNWTPIEQRKCFYGKYESMENYANIFERFIPTMIGNFYDFWQEKPTLRFVLIEHRNKKRQLCCPIRNQDGWNRLSHNCHRVLSCWIRCDCNAIYRHMTRAEMLTKFDLDEKARETRFYSRSAHRFEWNWIGENSKFNRTCIFIHLAWNQWWFSHECPRYTFHMWY